MPRESSGSEFISNLKKGLMDCAVHEAGVVIGISGGADSVGLTTGLALLAADFDLHLHPAHLNHSLRGDEANDDAQWLSGFAHSLGLPLNVEQIEVRDYAERNRLSIETAARELRYGFLSRIAKRVGCRFVALAHSSDDQVETVLHRLLRGSGLDGLAGMPRTRSLGDGITLVRPLLSTSRAQIEAYLKARGQAWRDDSTNRDESITRNRIRHRLLPLLEAEFNPRVRDAILRFSDQCSAAQSGLDVIVTRILDAATADRSPTVVRLKHGQLADWPVHTVRECFRILWKRQNWPRQAMGFNEWQRLADLTCNGSSATLPGGIDCRIRNELLVISAQTQPTNTGGDESCRPHDAP